MFSGTCRLDGAGPIYFQILSDGVLLAESQAAVYCVGAGTQTVICTMALVPATGAAQVFTVKWYTNGGPRAWIQAGGLPNSYQARLIAQYASTLPYAAFRHRQTSLSPSAGLM